MNQESRAELAEEAARRALAGLDPGPVLERLRRLTVRELLQADAEPVQAADLAGELDAVCTALRGAVRRRPGWLYAALPGQECLPVRVRGELLRAALLDAVRRSLPGGGPVVVECRPLHGAALLCVRGPTGRGGAVPPLWRRMARQAGGTAVAGSGAFSAVALLPLAVDLPLKKSPGSAALLEDRYGLLYLFLNGVCAAP